MEENAAKRHIEERMEEFHRWNTTHGTFSSIRLVQYCGVECSGGISVPLNDVVREIRGCLAEGFHVEWKQWGDVLYLCVFESWDAPLNWDCVFKEQDFG